MRGGVRGGRVGAVRAESTEELAGIRGRFRSVGRRVRVVRAATRAEKVARAARRASGAATHATRCAAFETGFLAWRDVSRGARARDARRSLRDDAGGAVARTGVSAGSGGESTPSASTRGAETESGGVGGGDGTDAEGSSFGGDAGASAGAGAVDAAAAASVESLPFFRSLLATARRPRRSSPGRRDARIFSLRVYTVYVDSTPPAPKPKNLPAEPVAKNDVIAMVLRGTRAARARCGNDSCAECRGEQRAAEKIGASHEPRINGECDPRNSNG